MPDDPENDNPELILIRAEIRALREQLTAAAPPPWHRRQWLPELHEGHLALPARHYWLRGKFRAWFRHRTRVTGLPPEVINKQRTRSLWLLVTTLIRAAFWLALIFCVSAGLAHVAGFSWARDLSQTIWFVALLSLYANFATDFGAAIAAYAALVASDVHSEVAVTSTALAADLADLDADVAQLAIMNPGREAEELAARVRTKLTGRTTNGGGRTVGK